MYAERRVACLHLVHRTSAVDAPVHDGRFKRFDAECSARRHCADFVVEAPGDVARRGLLNQVPLNGLRRPIEDLSVLKGSTQLDILGMRPHQRHRRAGRVPDEQISIGNVGAIPDLLRKEAAFTRQRLHGVRKRLRGVSPSGGEFVVGAFTGE